MAAPDLNLGNWSKQLTPPTNPGVAGSYGMPASSLGGLGGTGAMAMGGASAISAVGGMVSSILGYLTQKVQQESQARMAKAQYAHQDAMAKIDRDTSMKAIGVEHQKIDIQQKAQPELFKAQEELKKAQGHLATVRAARRETTLTRKATALNTKALDGIFHRGGYNYGKAVALAAA